MSKDDILPPRKRDWKPGHMQVGLFIRTEKGATFQVCANQLNDKEKELTVKLLMALGYGVDTDKLPKETDDPPNKVG